MARRRPEGRRHSPGLPCKGGQVRLQRRRARVGACKGGARVVSARSRLPRKGGYVRLQRRRTHVGACKRQRPRGRMGSPAKAGLRLSAQAEPCARAEPAQAGPQCVWPQTATFAECGLNWPEGQLACAVQHGRRAVTVSRSEDLRVASLPPLSPPLRLRKRRGGNGWGGSGLARQGPAQRTPPPAFVGEPLRRLRGRGGDAGRLPEGAEAPFRLEARAP